MLILARHLRAFGFLSFTLCSLLLVLTARGGAPEAMESGKPGKFSYYHDIRPILQANCQGCHQPAKAKGGYIMTDFKGLLAGGDSEGAAIVPEHLEKSALLKMVTP